MDPYKANKLGNAIQRTLAELLQTSVKDPRVGMVTIHGVELNRDHTVAKVYWSVMGGEEERASSLRGMKKASGFLQGQLARVLRLRQVPELRFFYDESLDRGLSINTTLQEMERRGELESEETRLRRQSLDDFQPPRDLMAALCRQPRRFWLVPHENPDPDAIGSALALGMALRANGAEVRVFRFPDPPPGLSDLPGFADATLAEEAEALLASEPPDAVVLVDCHRKDRTGSLAPLLEQVREVWAIDHHLATRRQAPLPGWTDSRASSASTLVHQVISELASGAGGLCEPITYDVDMATCIFAGLVGDTGGFRFSNTTPFCFELGRRLAEMGVDTAAVARASLHRYRRAGVELLREALGTLAFYDQGSIIIMHVDQQMLRRTGAVLSDTEGFVNIATAIDGVRWVAFLKQTEDGVWRVSLRSPGGGDAQDVAARYGGGGHRGAAGMTLDGPADDIAARLVADLREQDRGGA